MTPIELSDKFRGIFNSTFTFIGFLNTDGVLLEANNTAVEVAGITHDDVIGKYFWDCYWWQSSTLERERLRENFAKAVSGQAVTYEAEVLIKDGARTTILFSLRPVKNSQGDVIFIIPEGSPIQQLVDARTRMEAIIDGANAAVWEWNLHKDEMRIDKRWAEMLGFTLEDLTPFSFKQWLDLIHPADKDLAIKQLEACTKMAAHSYEMHYRVMRKTGKYIWVVDRAKLFDLTKNGSYDSLIGTRQDISQLASYQEKLRVVEDTFSNSFYHSGIGMALVSTEGQWLKVNPALSNMLGYTEAEFLRLTFQDITHPDDLQADLELLYETIDGKRESYQMEKRYRHKQGHFIDAILCVSTVRAEDSKVLYFVSQIIDISERKHVERLKNEFISTVSHELRTPLTSILGSIKLILSGKLLSTQSLPAKVSYLLNIAQENTERLAFLVNDLLDIEKISEGRMTYNLIPHQLVDLIEQAINSVAHYSEHLLIKDFSPAAAQAVVNVDEHRFIQVVINLLSNAIKFSLAKYPVKVQATITDGYAKISVEDKGIGISEAFVPHVFEKFSQADSGNIRSVKGSGLGLAISKALIEGMNGHIGYESVEGQGSTFWILLPIN
ncbi:PAS domain S-box protein [Rheinheimera sp. UJ63]|uniref:PAS domain S-box protein n=1 Tax=Rheinheimera sp. UJ63 TaxID=2910157 RepID=UPI001F3F14A3|nr:PAS domain S-box protein [Rheinheimera sp. UJ63]MCF4009887.1 PAS domain S-box protein [Rheinheimera sp. UJ63]